MRNNDFFALSKDPQAQMSRKEYVNRVAPTLIREAREELAKAAHHDNPHNTPEEKEFITEALLLDTQIPNWRNRGAMPLRYLQDGTLRAMNRNKP